MVPDLREYFMYIQNIVKEKLQVIILNVPHERCAVSVTGLQRMEDHREALGKESNVKEADGI